MAAIMCRNYSVNSVKVAATVALAPHCLTPGALIDLFDGLDRIPEMFYPVIAPAPGLVTPMQNLGWRLPVPPPYPSPCLPVMAFPEPPPGWPMMDCVLDSSWSLSGADELDALRCEVQMAQLAAEQKRAEAGGLLNAEPSADSSAGEAPCTPRRRPSCALQPVAPTRGADPPEPDLQPDAFSLLPKTPSLPLLAAGGPPDSLDTEDRNPTDYELFGSSLEECAQDADSDFSQSTHSQIRAMLLPLGLEPNSDDAWSDFVHTVRTEIKSKLDFNTLAKEATSVQLPNGRWWHGLLRKSGGNEDGWRDLSGVGAELNEDNAVDVPLPDAGPAVEAGIPSVSHCGAGLFPASEEDIEDNCTRFAKGDYVRLVGLKARHLNDRAGTVVCGKNASGRYGVRLHGDPCPKAFKEANLVSYSCLDADLCCRCKVHYNLFAFPACECDSKALTKLRKLDGDVSDDAFEENALQRTSSLGCKLPASETPCPRNGGYLGTADATLQTGTTDRPSCQTAADAATGTTDRPSCQTAADAANPPPPLSALSRQAPHRG